MTNTADRRHQSLCFLLLYALAWAGCSIAYVPFLTILLPVRVSQMAGHGADVAWLAYIAFFGAIASSVANIVFGVLSDRSGQRRGWIWAGLTLSSAALLMVTRAQGFTALVAVIFVWQVGLNMMIAPLAAWAGDCVPDSQKGLLGGLLACAPALGALSGAVVTMPGLASADTRLALVALLVAGCVVPVLIIGPLDAQGAGAASPLPTASAPPQDMNQPRLAGRDAMHRMWLARLAVQIAEAALFSYLYFWFHALDPAMGDNATARVFSTVLVISVPAALVAGRWADRHRRPIVPLVVCALIAALGLSAMAFARSLPIAVAAYALFGFASTIFLSLHSAQTLRVLPRTDRRGRDLGFFNLTKTVPSLIMPWLTLAMVPSLGFFGLFLVLAGLSLLAALTLAPLFSRS